MNTSSPVSDELRQQADAHSQSALRALERGDVKTARTSLEQALALDGSNAMVWLHLAGLCRALKDFPAAMAAADAAIKREPRSFLALLMRASLLERQGEAKQAALAYGIALSQAPPEDRLDDATRQALYRAREVNRRYVDELGHFIRQQIAPATAMAGSAEAARIALFVDATLGTRRIYRQEPSDFLYPGLPAIEFYERSEFPWLAEFEAATPLIQQELAQVLLGDDGFTPYVAYADHIPVEQWAVLNHSNRWNAFHFHHQGRRYQENCQRCPQTLAALAGVPQPQASGRMPAAMFSVLKANTQIPPHTGVANIRLVVHLPLVVPPDCGIRVGNQVRGWRVGEALIFDDTIEHEAWNNSAQTRAVLICDIWSPRLSATERDLIVAVMGAMDAYNGFVNAGSI